MLGLHGVDVPGHSGKYCSLHSLLALTCKVVRLLYKCAKLLRAVCHAFTTDRPFGTNCKEKGKFSSLLGVSLASCDIM